VARSSFRGAGEVAGFTVVAAGVDDSEVCCATAVAARNNTKIDQRMLFIEDLRIPKPIAFRCRTAVGGCS